jgi:hypothetical protein
MNAPMSALGHKQTFAPQKVMSALPLKADMRDAKTNVCFGPKADPVLFARSLHRRGEHSLIGLHDATLPYACAHLVGCEAVLIVRNGTFVVEARVLVRPVCRACGEHACACHNRGRHYKTNSHRWLPWTIIKALINFASVAVP